MSDDAGNFSSGYNSGQKRDASASTSNSKPSKKTKSNGSSGALPELALAKKYEESMNVKGYYMSEKLDGMRCLYGMGSGICTVAIATLFMLLHSSRKLFLKELH